MRNRNNGKKKTGEFLFANIGGLLAFAAIIFDAGGLREKVNYLSNAAAETKIEVRAIANTVQGVQTDVAILKARRPAK